MRPVQRIRSAVAVPRSNDRVLTGVAGGWAQRWGVEPTVVRAALGLTTLTGGVGGLVYLLAVAASVPAGPGVERSMSAGVAPVRRDVRREVAIALATTAVLVVARTVGVWVGDAVMLAASGVAFGVAVVWTSPAVTSARRWTRVAQAVLGIALVAAGVLSLASRTGGLGAIGPSAAAIAVVVGGLAMFTAPAIGRLLRSLDDERALRIREDERSAVAAHLHDSVLQSLVLIQRTDDPRRMARLARRQERELRDWLYGTPVASDPTTLQAALRPVILEVEEDHDVRVEVVVVGDQPLDDEARALVAAVREAVVNAARHADASRIDVFVEADEAELVGFVRDTGAGFDPTIVPTDRRGISESIVGRARRAGGVATLTSVVGEGTEVEIRIPRRRTNGNPA